MNFPACDRLLWLGLVSNRYVRVMGWVVKCDCCDKSAVCGTDGVKRCAAHWLEWCRKNGYPRYCWAVSGHELDMLAGAMQEWE